MSLVVILIQLEMLCWKRTDYRHEVCLKPDFKIFNYLCFKKIYILFFLSPQSAVLHCVWYAILIYIAHSSKLLRQEKQKSFRALKTSAVLIKPEFSSITEKIFCQSCTSSLVQESWWKKSDGATMLETTKGTENNRKYWK